MRIAVYGGSFDPPHLGHYAAVCAACAQLEAEKLLIIPDYAAPHKAMAENGATPEERFAMCRLAFGSLPNCEISDMELKRGGKSYTADTLALLAQQYPGADIVFLVGTDMLATFESWHRGKEMLQREHLAVFPREEGELPLLRETITTYQKRYGSRIDLIAMTAHPAASTEIRSLLLRREGVEFLHDSVYSYIIRRRLYGAKPSLPWLREKAYAMLKPKRIPHVAGCELEAVKLAERWGADAEKAAEAAILHDITKKEDLREQLVLCKRYGIVPDSVERESMKLLHAKTGAEIARERFGECEEVCEAIKWHTTGKPDMSLLEKVIYMADYIEPTRSFEGVERLRSLAYEDLDKAMILGFEMSLEDLKQYGVPPHENTLSALLWYQNRKK